MTNSLTKTKKKLQNQAHIHLVYHQNLFYLNNALNIIFKCMYGDIVYMEESYKTIKHRSIWIKLLFVLCICILNVRSRCVCYALQVHKLITLNLFARAGTYSSKSYSNLFIQQTLFSYILQVGIHFVAVQVYITSIQN